MVKRNQMAILIGLPTARPPQSVTSRVLS